MFIAFSEQLRLVTGRRMSHKDLRRLVVQYLKENPTTVSILIVFLKIIVRTSDETDAKTEGAFRCRKSSISMCNQMVTSEIRDDDDDDDETFI